MTSPVDTSVKNFNNTMVNVPPISGTAGSLIAALDAFLVTGFDTKTLTSLVALSGVMTATFAGTHSSQIDSVVLVAGVTGGPTGFAGANGEQKVAARPSSTTATWATTLPDGTYTGGGTITIKMAAAGWAKVYSGTNLAAYQSTDVAGTRRFLRVDDTNALYARVTGYETMTDVNTGTGPFPTNGQVSGGGWWPKSLVANATAVQFSFACDSRLFYIDMLPGSASSVGQTVGCVRGFGDPVSYRASSEPYHCVLSVGASAADSDGGWDCNSAKTYAARDYTGLGASTNMFAYALFGGGQYSGVTNSMGPFPNTIDGALYLSPKLVRQNVSQLLPRGEFPGLYHCPQSGVWDSFKHLDRVPSTINLTGRALQAWNTAAGSNVFTSSSTSVNTGVVFVDITGPWRS